VPWDLRSVFLAPCLIPERTGLGLFPNEAFFLLFVVSNRNLKGLA
jgi:hypothetical protein